MVYQEDVSKTAVALANFSHSDADGLRKIMSKKDKARKLNDYQAQFIAGARARGVDDNQIAAVWKMMMSFSGYSFCKPHSASYARVSFQAAYLKTHFPAEFMAAVYWSPYSRSHIGARYYVHQQHRVDFIVWRVQSYTALF